MRSQNALHLTVRKIKNFAKRNLPASVVRAMGELIHRRDPILEAEVDAAWHDKGEFFRHVFKALEFNGITGDYAEFGCSGGITFRLAYDQIARWKTRRHMWAFDSFQGLPSNASPLDRHPGWKTGAYATSTDEFLEICKLHRIPESAYTVVSGFYSETLARVSQDSAPADIALAYVDCDLYSSARSVLEFLKPRLKHGMILAFDDYFCWSAALLSGEKKAFLDVLADDENWSFVPYRDYSWAGHSLVVENAALYQS